LGSAKIASAIGLRPRQPCFSLAYYLGVAKARHIAGIEEDTPYAVAAAKVLATRTEELVEHSREVLDLGDIERVHDMRVATRRLRAALEVFRPCFPSAEFKKALREVKTIADALGERRDRDVSIAALAEFSESLAVPDRPGIESLVAKLRSEQADANEALAGFVDEARLETLRERLDLLASRAQSLVAGAGDASRNGGDPEGAGG
jgi:CHAD domain-containing protein